jgi:hypothetical protein
MIESKLVVLKEYLMKMRARSVLLVIALTVGLVNVQTCIAHPGHVDSKKSKESQTSKGQRASANHTTH